MFRCDLNTGAVALAAVLAVAACRKEAPAPAVETTQASPSATLNGRAPG